MDIQAKTSITYSDILNIFEGVAEILSSLSLMIFVVSHAEPAELIPTLGTSHVHAPLVLLNLYLALRTTLSV